MTTLSEIRAAAKQATGFRVQKAAAYDALADIMANHLASETAKKIKVGEWAREVGSAAFADMIKGTLPTGEGQAATAKEVANDMIDAALNLLETVEGATGEQTQAPEGEQPEAQAPEGEQPEAQSPEAQPEAKPEETGEQAQGSKSKRNAA